MMKRITCLIAGLLTLTLCAVSSFAKDYRYERDIPYRPASDTLSTNKMCRLDIAYLEGNTNAPVIVWFHGGGLTGGHRELPQALRVEPFVLIGVEYRLSPEASTDETIDDAAAAVAWAFNNAAKYGGSPDKIYLAGHSAG
ncbi:MAG: alpha/beta hydrolase fold domain-containing protein, partial [Verrucomicrobia bacterium]|nr:alpha/beta hydrolase fold domain-containing protein [Verrucomicrobiota bacterium]